MKGPPHASEVLDADLARLERERLVVVHLDDLDGLLCEPAADAFALRGGPYRAGIDDLALTLSAAVRLPDELTVRVLLPAGTSPTVPTAQAQAALRQRAADSASASWRAAMAVRSMGRRQLPLGMTVAVVSALVAYGAGYLASTIDNVAGKSLLVVTAGIAITVAWVMSWMVIESSTLDWRQSARQAFAYDLVARATLAVVTVEQRTEEPRVDTDAVAPPTDAPSTSA
jgi:hypothetical protein